MTDEEKKDYDPTFNGLPYTVISFVPAVPILVRCPLCQSTALSRVSKKDVLRMKWYLGCLPGCENKSRLFQYCGSCDAALAEVDPDRYDEERLLQVEEEEGGKKRLFMQDVHKITVPPKSEEEQSKS